MQKFIVIIVTLFSTCFSFSLQAQMTNTLLQKYCNVAALIQYENSPQLQQTQKDVFAQFRWIKQVGASTKKL